jgi:hypothetical protein
MKRSFGPTPANSRSGRVGPNVRPDFTIRLDQGRAVLVQRRAGRPVDKLPRFARYCVDRSMLRSRPLKARFDPIDAALAYPPASLASCNFTDRDLMAYAGRHRPPYYGRHEQNLIWSATNRSCIRPRPALGPIPSYAARKKLGAYPLGFDCYQGKAGSAVSVIAHDGHNTARSANDATCESFESGRHAPLDLWISIVSTARCLEHVNRVIQMVARRRRQAASNEISDYQTLHHDRWSRDKRQPRGAILEGFQRDC